MNQVALQGCEPEAFYVDGLYCTLHRAPAQTRRGISIVISPAIGRDGRYTYRSLLILADRLAKVGFDVFRMDPAGEGDSAEIALDADQWEVWAADLVRMSTVARDLMGARACLLLGMRQGATLARIVAREAGVDGLVLLDPLPTGEAWLKELAVISSIYDEPAPPGCHIQAAGLRLSHATAAALRAVDLATLPPLAMPVLFASPLKHEKVVAALGPGAQVERFPGYAKLFKEAFMNAYPEAMYARVETWLDAQFPRDDRKPAAHLAAPTRAFPDRVEGEVFQEEVVSFGDGLRGVVTEPRGARRKICVLVGNTGGDPRAGPGSFAALAARRLAARGVGTLRFDFAGIGESDVRFGMQSHVYDDCRTGGFVAGAELMAARGFDRPALFGVCTGGYHAVQAAVDEPRFTGAFAINAWLFRRPGLEFDRAAYLKSLGEEVMAGRPQVAMGRLLEQVLSRIPSRSGLPAEEDAVAAPDEAALATLERICAAAKAGRRLLLLQGERDPSREGLRDFGRNGFERMLEAGVVRITAKLDHPLLLPQSQNLALEHLYRFLQL
jgi:pimeloyl-ACP methyl ester carboxylesterase